MDAPTWNFHVACERKLSCGIWCIRRWGIVYTFNSRLGIRMRLICYATACLRCVDISKYFLFLGAIEVTDQTGIERQLAHNQCRHYVPVRIDTKCSEHLIDCGIEVLLKNGPNGFLSIELWRAWEKD